MGNADDAIAEANTTLKYKKSKSPLDTIRGMAEAQAAKDLDAPGRPSMGAGMAESAAKDVESRTSKMDAATDAMVSGKDAGDLKPNSFGDSINGLPKKPEN